MDSFEKKFIVLLVQDILKDYAENQTNLASDAARDIISSKVAQEILKNFSITPKAINPKEIRGSNA